MHAFASAAPQAWRARLELAFARRGPATRLVSRLHEGPLRVQKALYPEGEGVCHGIILHPPSGVAGGDQLSLAVEVGPEAHALLTTPGAGKWYRSAGEVATQSIALHVADDGLLEWLPQENIVFDGAIARLDQHITLARDARLIAWDIFCLGRRAGGERFDRGHLQLATRVSRESRPIWREQADIAGGAALLDSPAGLAGEPVCGIMLASGAVFDDVLLARLRALVPPAGQWGITRLPDVLVARYLGDNAEAARAWFVSLWQHLRPLLAGRAAITPRIWNT